MIRGFGPTRFAVNDIAEITKVHHSMLMRVNVDGDRFYIIAVWVYSAISRTLPAGSSFPVP